MTPAELQKAYQIADREPRPQGWEDELARAREIIAEAGDLPSDIAYEIIMRGFAPEGVDPLDAIHELRGPGAPAYPQTDRI